MRFLMSLLTIIVLILFSCSNQYRYQSCEQDTRHDAVILLHGLRARAGVMGNLKDTLCDSGYMAINVSYPSTRAKIPELAETAIGDAVALARQSQAQRIHVVTHSMGGIMVRYYLQQHRLPELGRVVMLSPPNHGTRLTDVLEKWHAPDWLNSPAGMQLGTQDGEFVDRLPEPVDYPVGIITSTFSVHPIASLILPGKDDGRVTVESARLEGMEDFKTYFATHHTMPLRRDVIDDVLSFLETGHFTTE